MVKEGASNTTSGNWIICWDDFESKEQFVKENIDEIVTELNGREEVSDVEITDEGVDINFYLDYCPNYEDIWHEFDDGEKSGNTDLNGVLDQNELGRRKNEIS